MDYRMPQPAFGGDWTIEKLERIQKYLRAYTTLMSTKPYFRIAYIDAFAGTGYQTLKNDEEPSELLLPELAEQDTRVFLDGSARQALQVQPEFNSYIFIEKDATRFFELQKLKEDFPDLGSKIFLVNAEANNWIVDRCRNYNWSKNRAVMFLDPFGMQVRWDSVKAIAETEAIDLWYLFPLGVAVNRLLKKDGNISTAIRQRLDDIFGTSDWYDVFYHAEAQFDLFGDENRVITKIANFASISHYFVDRLKTVFVGVAENPLSLLNSKGVPLFLLCFAAGNKKGAKTAIRIAGDILNG